MTTYTLLQLLAVLLSTAIIVGGVYFIMEYVFPWSNVLAEKYNVVRRDWESYTAWNKRTFDVMVLIGDAGDAFLAEAQRLGNYTMEGRSINYSLPGDHPLAIAYAQLKKGPHL